MKRTSLMLAVVLGLFMMLTITVCYAMSQGDEDLIRKIDGRRYTQYTRADTGQRVTRIVDVRGKTFVTGAHWEKSGYHEGDRIKIQVV